MLPKISRLVADKDFSQVYKRGRRLAGRNLRLFFLATRRPVSRFGFVIPKKAIPYSTGRNRVKRILRAAIRDMSSRLKSGYDVIIQGLTGSKTASPAALREELQGFLNKAQLLS